MNDSGHSQGTRERSWRLTFAAKTAVTLIVLGVISIKVDWTTISARLGGASLAPLLAALALLLATNVIVGLRWRLLANRLAIPLSMRLALEVTFTSLFLGQALPGVFGGDVVRFWTIWRSGQPARATFASVLTDRLLAFAGIVLVAAVLSMPLLAKVAPSAMLVACGMAVLVAAACVGALLLAGYFDFLPGWLARRGWVDRLVQLLADIRGVLLSSTVAGALALSVAIQLTGVVTTWLIAEGLHLPIGLLPCAAVVPAAVLLAALPVSVNGWGVREGAMIAGLHLYSVSPSDALILSLMVGFGSMVASLPGLIFWKTMRSAKPANDPSA